MYIKNFICIVTLVLLSYWLLKPGATQINASKEVWSLSSTTDCSGKGGGENFDSLCYNENGVNSTVTWIHINDPAIHFDVISGHQYRFSETANFTGIGGDFIANYLTDGNGLDYGSGNDWICSATSCAHDTWTKDFEAVSADLYFSQASDCSSSTGCYTNNLSLIDLSMPENPSSNPQIIWTLPSTTDCSGKGGTNGYFDNLCYNQIGVNSTVSWAHSNDPAISVNVIQGHTYEFIVQTPFIGVGSDFIANYLTDGNGYDYGQGADWFCSTDKCYHGNWTKIFTANSNMLFYLQGSGCSSSTNCFATSLQLIDLSSPSNPSPPPVLPSISKVFFVPGLGASWNPNALLNCTNDTNSDWTLASYAEGFYYPIIQAIKEYGWSVLPFYYDWRRPVSQNSKELATFIDINSIPDEKVDLVGHSMGGLVGRDYLEASEGGKLSSLLTIGSPHKGSALAYPPWAGGEIWNDNFLEKIAITLYLKHCGGIPVADKDTIHEQVPSVKDLLPIDPYLQKYKSNALYLPLNSENENDWLKNLSTKSWGVRIGYIAGTGFNTLKTIQTKDPNKRDSDLGNWVDGKPARKIFSSEGDGTVLSSSAILPNASFSAIINQTHTGLVTSTEGMARILEFLGKPKTETGQFPPKTNTPDFNSALIVIGYPASFTVTDQDGKSKKDKYGMISFMNPEFGSYKLNLIPRSNNTLFIVAQFLSSGDIKYKEYNFEGFGPKFKTIQFDNQTPQGDILSP